MIFVTCFCYCLINFSFTQTLFTGFCIGSKKGGNLGIWNIPLNIWFLSEIWNRIVTYKSVQFYCCVVQLQHVNFVSTFVDHVICFVVAFPSCPPFCYWWYIINIIIVVVSMLQINFIMVLARDLHSLFLLLFNKLTVFFWPNTVYWFLCWEQKGGINASLQTNATNP